MIERFQKSYNGDRITRPISGLSSHRAPLTGNIVELIIYDDHSIGTNIYNLSINGVAVFAGAGRPSVAGGVGYVIKSGLTQAVTKQDRVTLDVESAGSSGISSVTWEVSYDDGSPVKYGGSSTTSLAVGTGSKVFTTNLSSLELAYTVGSRVRAASLADPTKFIEGLVTSFSGTTLTILSDHIGVAGTVADWQFSLAGEPGTNGTDGADGTDGTDGAGVPAGGTAGQVLSKIDGTDYNTQWVDESGGGGGTIHLFTPDLPYSSPSAYDDEFDAGALDGKWTTVNIIPTITFDIPNHATFKPGTASGAMSGIIQNFTAADSKWRIKINPGNASSGACGILIRSDYGYFFTFGYSHSNRYIYHDSWLGTSGVWMGANFGAIFTNVFDIIPLYLEFEYVASSKTCYYRYSKDGITFRDLGNEVMQSSRPLNGVGIWANGLTTAPFYIDWFRKVQGSYTGGNASVS